MILHACCQTKGIASLLNRLGVRSAKGNTWTLLRVRSFRCQHQIGVYRDGERAERGEMILKEAAAFLGVSKMTVIRLIKSEVLPGEATFVLVHRMSFDSTIFLRHLPSSELLEGGRTAGEPRQIAMGGGGVMLNSNETAAIPDLGMLRVRQPVPSNSGAVNPQISNAMKRYPIMSPIRMGPSGRGGQSCFAGWQQELQARSGIILVSPQHVVPVHTAPIGSRRSTGIRLVAVISPRRSEHSDPRPGSRPWPRRGGRREHRR